MTYGVKSGTWDLKNEKGWRAYLPDWEVFIIDHSNNIMGVFTESIEECEKDVERFKNWPEMAEISKDVAQILRDAEKSMP